MARPARAGNGNALAKRLQVSRQRVSQMKKAGKVLFKPRSREIDEDATARMHQERLAVQQASPSRQIRDHYDAKMAKLQYERAIGLVVDIDKVKKATFEAGRRVRDNLENLPARLSGIFAAERDQQKIFALFTKEIHNCLEGLTHAGSR